MIHGIITDKVAKTGIIIIFFVITIMVICWLYRKFKNSKCGNSKVKSCDIPAPPSIQFFGRSKSETLAINAFAAALFEKGLDWRQIEVGHRHTCLKNPKTNRCLEFDAYANETMIALEYNGIQHYEFPNPFHTDEKSYQEGVERDNLKRRLCIEHGIKLIEIPYYIDTCEPDGLKWKFKARSNQERFECLKKYILERL